MVLVKKIFTDTVYWRSDNIELIKDIITIVK